MIKRRVIAAFALMTVTTPAVAAHACVPRAGVDALARFIMPDVVSAVGQRCAAALPPAAYLRARGFALKERLTPQSSQAFATARATFGRISGTTAIDQLKEATVRDLLGGVMTDSVAKLTPDDCGTIDRMLASLDPLPPENMARLLVTLVELGARGKARSTFTICTP